MKRILGKWILHPVKKDVVQFGSQAVQKVLQHKT